MHIGLTIPGSLEYGSGGFQYDRIIVERLRQLGEQVTVISLPWRSYARSLGDNLGSEVARRHQPLDFDVLIQDHLAHPALLRFNRRLRRSGRFPLVSLVHLLRWNSQDWSAPQRLLYRQVERLYFDSLDGLIGVSRYNLDLIGGLLGRGLPGVAAYPGGDHLQAEISAAEIRQRAIHGAPLHVVFTGMVVRRKGLHLLLEALAGLPALDWQLSVVGSLVHEPAYVHRLQRMAQEAGLSGRVRWLGRLSQAEIGDLYRQAHVFAMPSLAEGYAVVYLEAMGYGLPCLATAASGAGELLRQGENGYLVQPGDTAALQAHLGELAADRWKLAEMGCAARQAYLAHPTWVQAAEGIRRFLYQIAARHKKSPPG